MLLLIALEAFFDGGNSRKFCVLLLFLASSYPLRLPEIVEIVGKRAAFPLRFGHATQYYGKRVVLVGYIFIFIFFFCFVLSSFILH